MNSVLGGVLKTYPFYSADLPTSILRLNTIIMLDAIVSWEDIPSAIYRINDNMYHITPF
jgi:hypothetical protein